MTDKNDEVRCPTTFDFKIAEELSRARKAFPKPMNSAHEGIAVVREEFEELWEEVRRNPRDWQDMESECIQLGAMVRRFFEDVLEPMLYETKTQS